MALTFPPLRVESPLSQLHQVGIQILTSPSPHSPTQLSENRPKSVYCPTHVVRSWGIVQMANIAAAADIAGFILQYCAESGCTQFIFGNRISPRTTLHFSDPYTHKNATKANETCQNNSLVRIHKLHNIYSRPIFNQILFQALLHRHPISPLPWPPTAS